MLRILIESADQYIHETSDAYRGYGRPLRALSGSITCHLFYDSPHVRGCRRTSGYDPETETQLFYSQEDANKIIKTMRRLVPPTCSFGKMTFTGVCCRDRRCSCTSRISGCTNKCKCATGRCQNGNQEGENNAPRTLASHINYHMPPVNEYPNVVMTTTTFSESPNNNDHMRLDDSDANSSVSGSRNSSDVQSPGGH